MGSTQLEAPLGLRVRQQELLAELGACALRGGDTDRLLEDATRLVAAGLQASFCTILEVRPGEGRFRLRAGQGRPDGAEDMVREGDMARAAWRAVQAGSPVLSTSLGGDDQLALPPRLREQGVRRLLDVPIRVGDAAFGVIETGSPIPGEFGPADTAFAQAAANLLGVALERRRIEAALAASQTRTGEILESISDSFYAVDHEWRFTYLNRKCEEWCGQRRENAIGKVIWDLFPEAVGTEVQASHQRAARDRKVVHTETLSSVRPRWVEFNIFPSDSGLAVYFRDIDERKQAEAARERWAETLEQRVAERTHELAEANARLIEQIAERERAEAALLQAQRQQAISQLVGGVAHAFNNLHAVVIGNLELLGLGALDERARRQLDRALQAALRGGALTHQLLAYARAQQVDPRPIDANAVLGDMREALAGTVGEAVRIATDLAPNLWPALGDRGQLETIVLNLVRNAGDAMPGGGRLEIASRNVAAGAEKLPSELARGDYVMLAVSDTGRGMPPDVLGRACEPFFTTKGVGIGSGLGLAQADGVARQFGGILRLRSTERVGTTVELFLPRAERLAPQHADPGL